MKLNNDLDLGTINAIAKKVLCKHITVGAEDDSLTLFFKPGQSNKSDFDDDNNDDYEPEQEEERTPCIPDDMRHTDRFYDSEDVIIPGIEQRVSNTLLVTRQAAETYMT